MQTFVKTFENSLRQLAVFPTACISLVKSEARFLGSDWRTGALFFGTLFILPALAVLFFVALPISYMDNSSPLSEEISRSAAIPETLSDLMTTDALVRSRLVFARSDSIYLVISPPDSQVSLELHGTRIRDCRMVSCRIARGLDGRDPALWLQSGFTVERAWSTIPKMPIKTKLAPRDSIAAEKMISREPRPVEKEDVHFRLDCTRGLSIEIQQVQATSRKGFARAVHYRLSQNLRAARTSIAGLFGARIPEHRFTIRIEVTQDDARAIYRALPDSAGVLIRL